MYYANALQAQRTKIKFKYSAYQINLALLVLFLATGATYLFQINSLSTKGYEIRKFEQSIKALETQHKNLEVQSGNLQSINRIRQEANALNFVPAGNPQFIKDSDFALK